MAHNLARWTARIGLGERDRDHQDPQACGSLTGSRCGRITRLGAPPHFASPPAYGLGKPSSVAPWPGCKPFRSRPDGQPATDKNVPAISRHPGRESPLLRILSPSRASQLPHRALGATVRRLKTVRRPPRSTSQGTPGHLPCSSLTATRPSSCPHAVHRMSLRWIRARVVD